MCSGYIVFINSHTHNFLDKGKEKKVREREEGRGKRKSYSQKLDF